MVVSGHARPRKGIRVHSAATLLRRDIRVVDGVPCTSPARTLLDLAQTIGRRGLERTCDRALVLESVLASHDIGSTLTRSALEDRFLPICDRAGIRRPVADYTIDVQGEPVTVDFAWVKERVIVELDSWRYHGNPIAQARDHRRTRRLTLMGWCVLRVTASDLDDEPSMVGDLQAALARRGHGLP